MNPSALAGHDCRLCGSASLHEVDRFSELKRVTSDSRPWGAGGRLAVCLACGAVQKPVEPDWLDEIGRIYKSYAIYHQAGGQEQPIFTGSGAAPEPRSLSLVKFLEGRI